MTGGAPACEEEAHAFGDHTIILGAFGTHSSWSALNNETLIPKAAACRGPRKNRQRRATPHRPTTNRHTNWAAASPPAPTAVPFGVVVGPCKYFEPYHSIPLSGVGGLEISIDHDNTKSKPGPGGPPGPGHEHYPCVPRSLSGAEG